MTSRLHGWVDPGCMYMEALGVARGPWEFQVDWDLGTTAWYLLSMSLTPPDISCLKLPSSSS